MIQDRVCSHMTKLYSTALVTLAQCYVATRIDRILDWVGRYLRDFRCVEQAAIRRG